MPAIPASTKPEDAARLPPPDQNDSKADAENERREHGLQTEAGPGQEPGQQQMARPGQKGRQGPQNGQGEEIVPRRCAKQADVHRPGNAGQGGQRRQAFRPSGQHPPGDQIERQDIGPLHQAEQQGRDQRPEGLCRQEEGDIDQRVVKTRPHEGGQHVEAQPPLEQGIGDIPVIIAQVPAAVLAQPDRQPPRAEDAEGEQQQGTAGIEPGGTRDPHSGIPHSGIRRLKSL